MTQLSLTFYKQISRFLAFEFHFRCREYANIDIIARRLQILIYTVYTIENELAWIGTERMEMLLNLAWLWLEDAFEQLLVLVLGEKKDETMEETTGITIARGANHCVRVLCCSLESNSGEDSFVKLKRTIQQRVLFFWTNTWLYRPTYRFQCARSA